MTCVIAHRGARSLAPENTLAAARLGWECRAARWETDVTVTRDRELVLFHDQTLDRCTNVKRCFPGRTDTRVAAFSLSELQQLEAGSFFSRTDPFGQISTGRVDEKDLAVYAREPIPTLALGLCLVAELDWQVNLELKCFDPALPVPELTLEAVRRSGLDPAQVIFSSFNHDWLRQLISLAPEFACQALVGDGDTGPIDFGRLEFGAYNAHAGRITPAQIRMLREQGRQINLFTVNEPAQFHYFESLGVDGIFTDFPQRFGPAPGAVGP